MLAVLVTFSLVLSNLVAAAPASQPIAAPSKQPSVAIGSFASPAKIATKISPELQGKLAAGSKAGYFVNLLEQADTSNEISPLQWKEKGDYVYNKLTETANRTQAPLLNRLAALKQTGAVSKYQSFWIANTVYVVGNAASATALASSDAVGSLTAEQKYQPDPIYVNKAPVAAPNTLTGGLTNIGVPAVWAQGYYGQGITVGSMDTGGLYTHAAINRQWRGTTSGSSDYNWYDGMSSTTVPSDLAGDEWHGSHTIGTMVGDDGAGNQIGVAPQANWISCRIFDADSAGSGSSSVILNCGQWMLAPTDLNYRNPRPELRPQVVSNSWGGSAAGTVDPFFQNAVTNWINAGIFPNFSNGNAGPAAGTVSDPANYPNSFGVGASCWRTGASPSGYSCNPNRVNSVVSFSSRGPSPVDGGLKPQVIAPGHDVVSSIGPGPSTYASYDGTSMAAPHTAGTIALLLSKNRSLTVQQLKDVLTNTAFFDSSFMGVRPNNNFGYGRIDALAAISSVTATNGYVLGRVVDSGGAPVTNASISTSGAGSFSALVNANGYFTFTVGAGTYTLQAKKYGFTTGTATVTVMVGMTSTQNFTLTAAPTASVSGNVTGPGGTPISATVQVSPAPLAPLTNTSSYSFTLAQGSYTITVTPNNNCLAIVTRTVTVPPSVLVNISTTAKTDNFGYVCDNTGALNFTAGSTQISNASFSGGTDDGIATITMPSGFNFNYYGQVITGNVGVGSNGYIEFGGTDVTNAGNQLPDPTPPNKAIYAFLDDLVFGGVNGGATGGVYTGLSGTAPNRKFVIEWRNVQHFVSTNVNGGNYTFEIVLEEGTNNIYLQYQSMSGTLSDGSNATSGIENATGTDGITYAHLIANSISSGLAVRFAAPVPTGTPTSTPAITSTPTVTSTAVVTGTPTVTSTAVVTSTPTITSTVVATATATPCAISFSDVPTTYIFYGDIQFLACRGIVSGANGAFGPNNSASRGQFAKIAVLGFGITSFTPVTPTFVDVPANSIFYGFIEAAAHAGVVNGLTTGQCAALGTPGTCYGPNVNITRAQTAVIVQRAKNYALFTPTTPTFSDVPTNNFAYAAVETLAHNNIINGAACGTSLCFRPNDNIKRGELSKVVRRAIETAP